MFAVRPEVWPHLYATVGVVAVLVLLFRLFAKSWSTPLLIGLNLAILGSAFMVYFFRDPERSTPDEPDWVFAGADGKIMSIRKVREPNHLKGEAIRVSIFLSLLDVHVNRAPISGRVIFCDYFPGKRHFTFLEKSSEENQHSEIVIANSRVTCLVTQIVGPVARRIVYWVRLGQMVQAGQRIGMMKFGSRLDIYVPADAVEEVLVKPGDFVQAGLTPVIRLKPESFSSDESLTPAENAEIVPPPPIVDTELLPGEAGEEITPE